MVSSNVFLVSCRSIFESGENTAWPKKHGVIPMPNQVPIAGISRISHFAAASSWSSRPHVFSNAARENISTYALVQGPPCYTGSQFQHPKKCSDLKSKTCETTKEVFLEKWYPSSPRGWHTTVPPWSPGLDSWHICSDAVNLIPNSLDPEDSCLTLYGFERQLG